MQQHRVQFVGGEFAQSPRRHDHRRVKEPDRSRDLDPVRSAHFYRTDAAEFLERLPQGRIEAADIDRRAIPPQPPQLPEAKSEPRQSHTGQRSPDGQSPSRPRRGQRDQGG